MSFLKRFVFVAALSVLSLGTTAATVFVPTAAQAQTYTPGQLVDILELRIAQLEAERDIFIAAYASTSNITLQMVIQGEIQEINARIVNLETISLIALAGGYTDAEIDFLYELYFDVVSATTPATPPASV
ncbi:MAG: hypothetical protein HLUCCA24_02055 [Rhodobacteraceae bacterium HLUCCA24]|nr:MAG: hypothetical protein HLUCCA24_02055 [Rhodobacteraceae bacterium HLUCCA24]